MSGREAKPENAEGNTDGELSANSLIVAASTIMAIALSRKKHDQ